MGIPATLFLLRKAMNDGHLIAVKKQVHRDGKSFEQTRYVKPEDAKKDHLRPGGTWQVKDRPGHSPQHVNKQFTIDRQHEAHPDHWHVTYDDGQKGVVQGKHILQHAHPVEGDASKPFFDEKATKGLPDVAKQPAASKDELYAHATEAHELFREWLNKGKGVASQFGAKTMTKAPEDVEDDEWAQTGPMLFIAPKKSEKRAAEKVEADYGGDWSRITDVVRGTVAVDHIHEIHALLDALHQSGAKLAKQPKDRFAKPTDSGYRDILMNWQLPNGHICELQVNVKGMLQAKNKGHKPYEDERTIAAKYTDKDGKLKPFHQWDSTDQRAYQHAQDEGKRIYNDAWNRLAGRGDQKQMQKSEEDRGKFIYFEGADGAIFRQPADSPVRLVTEVKVGNDWKPYTGDAAKASRFATKITEEEANGSQG